MLLDRPASLLARPLTRSLATPASGAAAAGPSALAARVKAKLDDGLTLDDFVRADVVEEGIVEKEGDGRVRLGRTGEPRLPTHLRSPAGAAPTSPSFKKLRSDLRGLGLHTVCEEARCPNIGECWGGSSKEAATATIMLMGDTCTRACRFCSVKTSRAPPPLDVHEPENTAEAIGRWGIGYVVLTSVDRDDLPDGGAAHFASTIRRIKSKSPSTLIEALTGDFHGSLSSVRELALSGLDVYAHNVETSPECTPFVRDRRASFAQSLRVLEEAKRVRGRLGAGVVDGLEGVVTKTSIMLGVGETEEQVMGALKQLRQSEVDVVTFGQYMRPTKRHMKVHRYVDPAEFERWKTIAEDMGFLYVASGPLVRSSYKAGEFFIKNVIEKSRARGVAKAVKDLAAAVSPLAGSSSSSSRVGKEAEKSQE